MNEPGAQMNTLQSEIWREALRHEDNGSKKWAETWKPKFFPDDEVRMRAQWWCLHAVARRGARPGRWLARHIYGSTVQPVNVGTPPVEVLRSTF